MSAKSELHTRDQPYHSVSERDMSEAHNRVTKSQAQIVPFKITHLFSLELRESGFGGRSRRVSGSESEDIGINCKITRSDPKPDSRMVILMVFRQLSLILM